MGIEIKIKYVDRFYLFFDINLNFYHEMSHWHGSICTYCLKINCVVKVELTVGKMVVSFTFVYLVVLLNLRNYQYYLIFLRDKSTIVYMTLNTN